MNKVIPKFNIMSEEDKKELIKILTDYKPVLEDALEDLENALTTDDNEQLLEVIDTLQHDFSGTNMSLSWYQAELEKLTPISNKYYNEEYSKEQDRIHKEMMKEYKEAEESEEAEIEAAQIAEEESSKGI